MDKLIVSGSELDLYPDSKIALTYQINNVADLKDRQSSYSLTFKVPKTKYNQQILEYSNLIQSSSDKPYKWLPCKVVRSGLEIIADGIAVIENTDENFNLTVYSGVFDFFSKIDGKTLRDLNLNYLDHTYDIPTIISLNNNAELMYPLINYGYIDNTLNEIDVRRLRPAISFWTLFREIIKQAGFNYDIPTSIQNYIDGFILPWCGNLITLSQDMINESLFRARCSFNSLYTYTHGGWLQMNTAVIQPIIAEDVVTPPNFNNGMYNPLTGTQLIRIPGTYNYYGKVKIRVRVTGIPVDNSFVIRTNLPNTWTIGSTVTDNFGNTATVSDFNGNYLYLTSPSNSWVGSFFITDGSIGDSITNVYDTATWSYINQTITSLELGIVKNGVLVHSAPISVTMPYIINTNKVDLPAPDRTDWTTIVGTFDTTGHFGTTLDFIPGDVISFEILTSLSAALFTPVTTMVSFIPTSKMEVEYLFDNVADTNVIGCHNIIVNPNIIGTTYDPFIYGRVIRITDVLPDMTQTDFMKAVAQMMALIFDHNVFYNNIVIRRFNDIAYDIPYALDWSDKVDKKEVDNMLIDFHSGFAYNNIMKFAEDDNDPTVGKGVGDGSFIIQDDTLQKEKVVFQLPFAPTQNNKYLNRQLSMPIITMIEIPTTYDFSLDVTQRVLLIDRQAIGTGAGTPNTLRYRYLGTTQTLASTDIVPLAYYLSSGSRNGAFWNSLITDNYTEWITLLQNYRKITLKMKLTDSDVFNFNFFKPVFISQLNAYFYVNKISNHTGVGLTKVELIRL